MCVTSLRLAVTPSMAPLGRLLVFYVRENGEGVADSLQFAVESFFENQVERGGPIRGVGTGKRHRGLGAPGCPRRAVHSCRSGSQMVSRAGPFRNNCSQGCFFTGAPPEVTTDRTQGKQSAVPTAFQI